MSGEKVIASFLSAVDDPAELALQPIDGGRKPPGVYEIVVGMKVEVSNDRLEPLHVRHTHILQTNLRTVKHNMQLYNPPKPPQVHPLPSPS